MGADALSVVVSVAGLAAAVGAAAVAVLRRWGK